MNFIWGSMNDMSFLTILTLISISVPGIAQVVQAIILKFLYLDIMMTEEWLTPWITKELETLMVEDEETQTDDEEVISSRILQASTNNT